MKERVGLLVLCGIVFFLGREWWLGSARVPKITSSPGFVAVQFPHSETYLFGNEEIFNHHQPFGHFFDNTYLAKPESGLVGKAKNNLHVWDDDFAVLQTGDQRIFWFGAEFSWLNIAHLPINLESQIWLLDKTVPPDFMPPPRHAIVWYDRDKKAPKKLKELSAAKHIPLLVTDALGQFQLRYKNKQWKLY